MTTVLGVNISHHTSICQVTNGVMDFFYDEGRVSRVKDYHATMSKELRNSSFKGLESINRYVDKEKIDHVVYSSFGRLWDSKDYHAIDKIQKQLGCPSFTFNPVHHHLYHAECAYYLSKLDRAIVVVMDGGGSMRYSHAPFYQEIESIYYVDGSNIEEKFKHLTAARYKDNLIPNPSGITIEDTTWVGSIMNTDVKLSMELSAGMLFTELTVKLGLGDGMSAGKTMGLAAYGNLSGTRPEDEAKQLQEKTKHNTVKLIQQATSYADCKDIILSGGYSLNCTNNYLYLSEFPSYNFFIDPIGHDGGTALGAALYYFRKNKLKI